MGRKEAYIAEIHHNVEEELGFFIVVARFVNGFFGDKVFGDLGPHCILAILLPDKPSTLISVVDDNLFLPDKFSATAVTATIFLGNEFAPPYTVIPLPCNLLLRTSNPLHLYPFRSWRHIHNRPVFRSAVVPFSNIAPFCLPPIVIFRFLSNVQFVAVGVGARGRRRAGRAATTWGWSAAVDDNVFIIVSTIAGAMTADLNFFVAWFRGWGAWTWGRRSWFGWANFKACRQG